MEPVKPSVNGNRVEYQRDGIVEWYVNDTKGLEQGFTLLAPPVSDLSQSQIALHIKLAGNLTAGLNKAIQTIEFTTPGGVGVIHFGKLHAHDATNSSLLKQPVPRLSNPGVPIAVNSI